MLSRTDDGDDWLKAKLESSTFINRLLYLSVTPPMSIIVTPLLQIVAYFYVKSMSVGDIAVKVVNLRVEENGSSVYSGN